MFRLSNVTHRSEGILEVRTPITADGFINIYVNVIDRDIPLLIGVHELTGKDF